MRRLEKPSYSAMKLYDESVAGLSDTTLRAKFEMNRTKIVDAYSAYDNASTTKTWCHLPQAKHAKKDQIIVGNLSKGELVDLYTNGVVKSKGKARTIYEQIKLSAHEECPYCGGVGEMGEDGELGTADHFLPKAYFPSYSVLPLNLVPACDVCNSRKNGKYPIDPNLQPLHPYLDELHFFNEKWTTANLYKEDEPVIVDFGIDPPLDWDDKDRRRVEEHFKQYNLRARYRSRVQQELAPLIYQRKTSLRALNARHFRAHLKTVADEPNLPINGWKRTMYSALANSKWFCENVF